MVEVVEAKKHRRRQKRKRAEEEPMQEQPAEQQTEEQPQELSDTIQLPAEDPYLPDISEQAFYGKPSDELLEYFRSLEPMLTAESLAEKTPEEAELFIDNVYSEVDRKELMLATDYDCSRIMEKLILCSGRFQLRVLLDRLSGNFYQLFTHRFGSHVVQTLLGRLPVFLNECLEEQENVEEGQGVLRSLVELFVAICEEIKPCVSDLMRDKYGSHLLRLVLNILGGYSESELIRSQSSKKYAEKSQLEKEQLPEYQPPDAFKNMLTTLIVELTATGSGLIHLAMNACASPVLQLMMIILQREKMKSALNSLINALLMELDSPDDDKINRRKAFFGELVRDAVGSHLVQKILNVAPKSTYEKIFQQLFTDKLFEMAQHSISNYVIQSLLETLKTKAQLEAVYSELVEHTGHLMFRGRSAIAVKLASTCLKLNSHQEQLYETIVSAFKIPDEHSNMLVHCVLRLQSYADYEKMPGKMNTSGVVLMQTLMQFDNPQKLIEGLFKMQKDQILELCTNASGSRVMEEFFKSSTVDHKQKRAMTRKLGETYSRLAMDKFGSHVLEACWAQVNLEMRVKIAEELVQDRTGLMNSFYGRFILRNFRIDDFKQKKAAWLAEQKKASSKNKNLKDILE